MEKLKIFYLSAILFVLLILSSILNIYANKHHQYSELRAFIKEVYGVNKFRLLPIHQQFFDQVRSSSIIVQSLWKDNKQIGFLSEGFFTYYQQKQHYYIYFDSQGFFRGYKLIDQKLIDSEFYNLDIRELKHLSQQAVHNWHFIIPVNFIKQRINFYFVGNKKENLIMSNFLLKLSENAFLLQEKLKAMLLIQEKMIAKE